MSTDRLAGRQYQDKAARAASLDAEQTWLRELVVAATPAARLYLAHAVPAQGAPGRAACQALADEIVAAAGPPFGAVCVVWLPDKQAGRGQLMFRLAGNLIQLVPDTVKAHAPAVWLETVAHETFHHLQQELLTAFYRGEPALAGRQALLAGLYRDARASYKVPSELLSATAHRKQLLEVGAWQFGASLARAAASPNPSPR